jgi:hypothetical protein
MEHLRRKLGELNDLYQGKFDLGVIIGLRHPQAWVLSIYKHYLKYGGVETFDGFLGLVDGTKATMSAEDLRIMPKIRLIEKTLGVTPFCFFMEEIRMRPDTLSKALAKYAGVDRGPSFISSDTPNEGVNQNEARICRKLNRNLVNRGCLGNGWIKRNKTHAFRIARSWAALGTGPDDSSALEASDQAKAHLHASLDEDLDSTLAFIASQREIATGEMRSLFG